MKLCISLLALFFTSCGQETEETTQPKKSRFEVFRLDQPGPVVYLIQDSRTQSEYLFRSEWIQKLPAQTSPELERK